MLVFGIGSSVIYGIILQLIGLGKLGGREMAKQGMKRPERTHTKPRNDAPPVPELQGKEKTGKKKV